MSCRIITWRDRRMERSNALRSSPTALCSISALIATLNAAWRRNRKDLDRFSEEIIAVKITRSVELGCEYLIPTTASFNELNILLSFDLIAWVSYPVQYAISTEEILQYNTGSNGILMLDHRAFLPWYCFDCKPRIRCTVFLVPHAEG